MIKTIMKPGKDLEDVVLALSAERVELLAKIRALEHHESRWAKCKSWLTGHRLKIIVAVGLVAIAVDGWYVWSLEDEYDTLEGMVFLTDPYWKRRDEMHKEQMKNMLETSRYLRSNQAALFRYARERK